MHSRQGGRSTGELKTSEEIRKNIFLISDKDTIDLYVYMTLIYRRQGNYVLADRYQERRKTIETYLNRKNMVSSGAPYSEKVSGEDENAVLDLSKYNAGGEWQMLMDEYINALQACDVNMLMDTLQLEFVELVPAITSQELGVEADQEELISLYTDFYQEELSLLRKRLTERYGDEYNIQFEPYEIAFVSDHEINVVNDYLFTRFDSEIVLEDVVSITGRFQVTGKTGSIPGEETEGFLCGELILLEANGEWKLGVPEGFPQMPQDRLKEFLGIQ